MRRKKTFTLVEVVVALAIFSLCALPLLRQPFILAENSYNYLFEAELFRHAEVARCTLFSDLQTTDIPWSSLPKSQKIKYALPSTSCHVDLGEKIRRTFLQTVTIGLKTAKKISHEQEALLLEITITYSPKGKKKPTLKAYTFSYLVTAIGPGEISS